VRWSDLELTLATAPIPVSLVEGLAPGASDFEQETRYGGVEEIDPPCTGRALAMPNERGR